MSSRRTRASSTRWSGSGEAPSPSTCRSGTWPDGAPSPAASRLDHALAFFLAPRCVACGGWLLTPTAGPVCGDCWGAVRAFTPPLCRRCGAPVPESTRAAAAGDDCAICRREPLPSIARAAALGSYEGALRRIVHALKFRRCPTLGARLAARLRDVHRDVISGIDVVVPVPLHPSRRRQRGFNQSLELARHLGPPVRQVLRRTRRTRPQPSLHATDRRRNVSGAFALARRHRWATHLVARMAATVGLAGWSGTRVEGAHVLLVDDVWTTGATLEACAEMLLRAGAGEVRALTVARALPAANRASGT